MKTPAVSLGSINKVLKPLGVVLVVQVTTDPETGRMMGPVLLWIERVESYEKRTDGKDG